MFARINKKLIFGGVCVGGAMAGVYANRRVFWPEKPIMSTADLKVASDFTYRVPKTFAKCFADKMKPDTYLHKKTQAKIIASLTPGNTIAGMGVVLKSGLAVADFHEDLQRGGLSGPQLAAISMNGDMHMALLQTAMFRCLDKQRSW
jgi:hypothetical protein